MKNTPNANMADLSVLARDESHESEASQSLMFCFDSTLLRCRSDVLCFAPHKSFCVRKCCQNGVNLPQ